MKLNDLLECIFGTDDKYHLDKDIDVIFTDHTDEYIIEQIVKKKIKGSTIVNLLASKDLNPSREECKSHIENLIKTDEKFLSELLNQIPKNMTFSPKEGSLYIHEEIIKKYKEPFQDAFKITPGHFKYKNGLGYSLGMTIDENRNQIYQLKNGAREQENEGNKNVEKRRGWKLHISLNDEIIDGVKLNLIAAWNAIVDHFFLYQIKDVKMVGNETIEDTHNRAHPNRVGKQVTIYINQFVEHPETFAKFLENLTYSLIEANIIPSFTPTGDKRIAGSEFFSYRYDTYPKDHDKHGQRREGDEYVPENVTDPFLGVSIHLDNQNRSKVIKPEFTKSEVEKISAEKKPVIPRLALKK